MLEKVIQIVARLTPACKIPEIMICDVFPDIVSEIPVQDTGSRITATGPLVAVIQPPATEATGGRIMATVETMSRSVAVVSAWALPGLMARGRNTVHRRGLVYFVIRFCKRELP